MFLLYTGYRVERVGGEAATVGLALSLSERTLISTGLARDVARYFNARHLRSEMSVPIVAISEIRSLRALCSAGHPNHRLNRCEF